MTITPDEFNAVIDEWKDWQTVPWGRLFYRLANHYLARHLPGRPLTVLDIGGGNGKFTLELAAQGHTVTLLDYSPAMLADAHKQASQLGLLQRITFIEADAQAACALLAGQTFDLLLCNLMIEFLPDPLAFLKDLPALLAPGGLLSLIDGNRYCEPFRAAVLNDNLEAARQSVGSTQYPHRWFNRSVPIYSAQEVIDPLQSVGLTLAGQYGIWCVCQYLPNDRKYEPDYFHALEQLEIRLGETYPYYLLARMFQVIMQKN